MPNFKAYKSITDIERRASSKTLNKNISELTTLLEGNRITVVGGLRGTQQEKLFELLRQEARFWYKRGFKRGHQTSYREGEKVPIKITRRMRINAPYLDREGEPVTLKSDINKSKKDKKKV